MSERYKVGSVVFGNWIIQKKIGEGSFGKVFEIQRKDFGEVYRAALKVITVPQNEGELTAVLDEGMTHAQAEQYFYGVVEDIVREFAIMAKLKGTANVVGYEDHVVIRHENECKWDILIRMELLNPLLPYAYEHPFARRDVIRLGIDMCRALELCQKYNVIHRDIKPENIFVSDNEDFKLGDFGIARTIDRTMSGLSKKGTYNYMAPEVYRGGDYGFNVDLYSLGIVLYRLLNKNRTPFLPPAPEPITFQSREKALAKRMGGESLPAPYYAQGRLCEIVLKACAFEPKDRYDSPEQMRRELEAILYDESDAELIYPDGDELALSENVYASRSSAAGHSKDTVTLETEATQSIFGAPDRKIPDERISADGADAEESGTVSIFGDTGRNFGSDSGNFESTSKTESIFSSEKFPKESEKREKKKEKEKTEKSKEKKSSSGKMIGIAAGTLLVGVVIGGGWYYHQQQQTAVQEKYQQLLAQGTQLLNDDAEAALQSFSEAHALYPEKAEPMVSYAYALFVSGDYEFCISYIEDDLALGKSFEPEVQSRLSEILASAYFEMGDYAAAASFFRLSTAGDDITVSAQRDYAIALAKLGDYEAAKEILHKMQEAGAEDEVTVYVQAEVNTACGEYSEAEKGFLSILSTSEDAALQKRAFLALAELYQTCAVLNESPIDSAAEKLVALLSEGISRYNMSYDSTLWEMLAWGYYQAHQTENGSQEYLLKAAESFEKVLDQGIRKDYIYRNLYAIYYEMADYENAQLVLGQYQEAFSKDYMPHALRAILLISMENQKEESVRDYAQAVEEYETAGEMIRNGDDSTYYQQLETLIEQLRSGGWIS